MKTGTLILTGIVMLALGLAVGVYLTGDGATAAPPDADREQVELEHELQRLRDENADLRTRKVDPAPTAEAPAPAPTEPAEAAEAAVEADAVDGTAAEPVEAAASGPRFFAEEYNGVLKKVDWNTVGTNMGKMSGMITRIARALTAGEQPVQKDLMEIQKLNMDLIKAAVTVQDDLPGIGINGKFSSPPFMINALAATLESSGLPLTDRQAKSLEVVGKDYAAKDEARIAGYDDRTFELKKLVEEAELKGRFFDEVFAWLDAKQLAVVRAPETKNRVRLDLFSDSLIYSGRVGITMFSKREDLVDQYVKGVTDHFRLTTEQTDAARPLIEVWVDEIPQPMLDEPVDRLDRDGLVASTRATAWGRQTLPLLMVLSSELDLTENQVDTIRGAGYVLVPLRRDAE